MGLFNRKKENTAELIAKIFAEARDYEEKRAQEIRPILLREQHVWEPNYGLDKSNPVISESVNDAYRYLGRLCTANGEKLTRSEVVTLDATVHGLTDVTMDRYTLCLNGKPYNNVYIVPNIGKAEFPPAGLYFSDDKRDWDAERHHAERAYDMGVDIETEKRIMRLEADKAERDSKEAAERKEAGRVISQIYPDVNIDEEITSSLFAALYNLQLDPVMIYEYVHSEQLLTRKEQPRPTEDASIPDEVYYYQVLLDLYQHELDELNEYINRDEVAAAKDMGVSLETCRHIRALSIEASKEQWAERKSKIIKLSKQAVELKKDYPSFNIEEEIQNELFVKLLDAVSIREAYEIIHFSDYFERKNSTICPININSVSAAPKAPIEKTTITAEISRSFCINCGQELKPDWEFCNKCGHPVKRQSPEPESSYENEPVKAEEHLAEAVSEDTIAVLDMSSLPPKLRRAFILVEDEEWEKAEKYFEDILDEEPENAYAYLGKALIQIKVDSPASITEEEIRAICETKSFSRAAKYADGQLKQLLDSWKGSINK